MTKSNQQIVGEFFQFFSSTDVAAALELLDDIVVWRVMGREGGLPMSGEMNRQGIGELITNVKSAMPDGLKLTPKGWTCEGDRVALEMESHGVKTNGTVYNNLYHFLITVFEGKITSIREYMDTLHAKLVFIDDE